MATAAEFCRVSIRTADAEVDLALPADIPIGELLPAAIDLITGDNTALSPDVGGREVRLSRPGAAVLDPTKSLAQCGVRDGELLLLATASASPLRQRFDACAAVASTVESMTRRWSPAVSATAATAVAGWSAVAAGVLLAMPLVDADSPRHIGAAAAAGSLALILGLMIQRRHRATHAVAATGVAATGVATLTGSLAVPGSPGVPSLLLAMSACAAVSLVSSRVVRCSAAVLVPTSGTAAATATATLGAVLGWWPTAAIGPILATTALAALSVAPRVASRTAHLSATAPIDDTLTRRAVAAHRRLTTVVVTSAAAAALGTVVTALTTPPTLAVASFIAVVSAVLLLHTRTHTELSCIAALFAGSGVAGTSLLGIAATANPAVIPWLCGLLGLVAASSVRLASGLAWQPSPTAARAMRVLEFAATTAVVPLACWTLGLFEAARGLSLP